MTDRLELIEMTTELVASYVGSNAVSVTDVPRIIENVHSTMSELAVAGAAAHDEPPTPAVPIKKSVTPDHLICLEDGRKFKSLKRHLRTQYDMSPEDYRRKWGLPADYPMVAPNYAKARSDLAKRMGLGQSAKGRKSSKS